AQPAAKQQPVVFLGSGPADRASIPLSEAKELVSSATQPDLGPRGRVLSESLGSNRYSAQVAVERPTTLMLKVTYHPGWHAYVDGIETPTMMLMPSFIGVPIRPGTHEVRMEYQPQPLRHERMLAGLLGLGLT